AAHKRMPQGDKELRELVAPLVAETGEKRSWWPWSYNKMQFEPPDKFVDEFAQKFQKKYGRAPSRQEMGVMYERSLRGK
ncbi:MAG TPA: hypothetical protein VFV92_02340, partial [Candidatus Bathyarchaeia archaeon]|nr:hypothetical protein [Candidatus Bathyarchaeia archaeon]